MNGIKDIAHAEEIIRQLSSRLRTALDHVGTLTQEHLALKADHGLLNDLYQALVSDHSSKEAVEPKPEAKKAKRKK